MAYDLNNDIPLGALGSAYIDPATPVYPPKGMVIRAITFLADNIPTVMDTEILDGSGAQFFGTNSTERMRIISTGNVGIGTASPTTTLDVSGSLRSYSTTIQSKPATSMSINFTQANNFFIDLKHDSALSASHDSICVGQSGVVSVRQDGTGGHDLTLPSSWKTPRPASITWNDNPDDMN